MKFTVGGTNRYHFTVNVKEMGATIFIPSYCLTHYCAGNKIEKIEMGGACSMCGGEYGHTRGFGGET
jgi:hypothetical protein